MERLLPSFKRKYDGTLVLSDSLEALTVKRERRETRYKPPESPATVRNVATSRVERLGGDISDIKHLLGQFQIQFGQYRNETFHWLTENALGYVGYIVASTEKEIGKAKTDNTWLNKMALRKYIHLFKEGDEAVDMKSAKKVVTTSFPSELPDNDDMELAFMAEQIEKDVKEKSKTKWSKRSAASVPFQSVREHMFSPEKKLRTPESDGRTGQDEPVRTTTSTQMPSRSRESDSSPVSSSPSKSADLDQYPIYAKWRDSLPKEDVKWISQSLFTKVIDKRGERAHMVLDRVTKMWWYPPEPPLQVNSQPSPNNYFGHRLFLWMPHKLWRVRLTCPHEGCQNKTLSAAGVYNKLRTVVDVSSTYLLASEYLACPSCKRKVISWNWNIIQQLDPAKQRTFPCILTSMKACDMKVVKLLRERSLGNSCHQTQKMLTEQHSEEWLAKTIAYLTDCKAIQDASSAGLVEGFTFDEPPRMLPVPLFRWLMQVYIQDVLMRLPDVKADITSTFGRILKMDSTKKVVGKLAGPVRGTAMWATNIGNEIGQVLTSVITSGEGHALASMAEGIMARYKNAGAQLPEALYVDRDCCGSSPVRTLFHQWETVPIRLDIWHFMRRFSGGCTSESHPLYGQFMNQLSRCIFMWDMGDLNSLKEAKLQELSAKKVSLLRTDDVLTHISKNELALHCRRSTRGAEETVAHIENLLDCFKDAKDTMGIPLLKNDAMEVIWKQQKHHVSCIQDPPGVHLYLKTGTRRKGNMTLPTYRCARGSTSLESFHLHLNRFIPGTLANEVLFQAYLLEGVARWNQNRATSTQSTKEEPVSYSHALRQTSNHLSEAIFGKKIVPSFSCSRKYTGECIGLDYLLNQTGKASYQAMLEAMQDGDEVHPDIPEEDTDIVEEDVAGELFTAAPAQQEDVAPNNVTSLPQILPILTEDQERALFDDVPDVADVVAHNEVAATIDSDTEPMQESHAPSPITPTLQLNDERNNDTPDDSLGPDHLPGYFAVQNLAESLVALKDGNLALKQDQAAHIIRLWQALSEFDKRRTVFQERFDSGTYHKFRAPKTPKHPGVQSLECSVRAPDSIPAAKPDCNRYVEAVVQRLCQCFRSASKAKGKSISRWTRIMEAYNRIQQTVLYNPIIMTETEIQLPFLNHRTLQAWYNNKLRTDNTKMLTQGLDLPDIPLTSTVQLPAPVPLPVVKAPPGDLHTILSPPNTAGSMTPKEKKLTHIGQAPSLQQNQTFAIPTINPFPNYQPVNFFPIPVAVNTRDQLPVHYQTERYRRIKAQEEAEGKQRRVYMKTKEDRICKRCNKKISKDTHTNLWGALYCPTTATETIEEFRKRRSQEMKNKRKK